ERLLFNCPEGTARFMTENKMKLSNWLRMKLSNRLRMKLSNRLRSIYFTRGAWGHMSGITDVILKAKLWRGAWGHMSGITDSSEEGQTDLRLVGPRMAEYARSTAYFLGQRPQLTLELHSFPADP
ncbi:hypothetical protein T484DRAFT_1794373, partial [Baffinella frigidus]